jgi:ATP-binding cassette subfamily C protein LapB
LVGWHGEDEARILLSESDGGEVVVKREVLAPRLSTRACN